MKLPTYLKLIESMLSEPAQMKWFERLRTNYQKSETLKESLSAAQKLELLTLFQSKIRTEEIKAWYGEPEGDSLFQGTSVTSLTIPHVTPNPIDLDSIETLEDHLVDAYLLNHHKHRETLKNAMMEDTSTWISEGLYYGVVIGSKLISQAFGLKASHEEVIFDVKGVRVDPHEILTYPPDIRESYFEVAKKKLACFQGLDVTQQEFEESLLLADISKPKLETLRSQIILGPIRCNEICAVLSKRLVKKIWEKSKGEVRPRSLMVTIYDSDTPYTYHQVAGYLGRSDSPVLPGLTVLGSSGSIESFRWLYSYRTSLVAQKMMKGSVYSQVHSRFIPFVFFGVLVERDAEILLNLNELSLLRYRGNLSPQIEYQYLLPKLVDELNTTRAKDFSRDFELRSK